MKKLIFFLPVALLFISCSSSKSVSSSKSRATEVNIDSLEIFTENELDQKVKIKGGMLTLLRQVEYPRELRRQRIEGKVVVQLIVLDTGKAINIKVKQSNHPDFTRSALRAIKSVRFTPGIKDDKKVNSFFEVPLTFNLRGRYVPAA